ncbi:hypothetical protein K490DRAFT_62650 [Saccharata proteae CBS 121410]|uniref:Uncharacterized protein n=1 Tax=Saccharata proteae CBS 121410 TaxID=1314787 RepID=A0A9P4I0Q0_9PEZI|nr:hypothetical protein K490DRAFT_62650 [Saccharata proteae CBS 121410]
MPFGLGQQPDPWRVPSPSVRLPRAYNMINHEEEELVFRCETYAFYVDSRPRMREDSVAVTDDAGQARPRTTSARAPRWTGHGAPPITPLPRDPPDARTPVPWVIAARFPEPEVHSDPNNLWDPNHPDPIEAASRHVEAVCHRCIHIHGPASSLNNMDIEPSSTSPAPAAGLFNSSAVDQAMRELVACIRQLEFQDKDLIRVNGQTYNSSVEETAQTIVIAVRALLPRDKNISEETCTLMRQNLVRPFQVLGEWQHILIGIANLSRWRDMSCLAELERVLRDQRERGEQFGFYRADEAAVRKRVEELRNDILSTRDADRHLDAARMLYRVVYENIHLPLYKVLVDVPRLSGTQATVEKHVFVLSRDILAVFFAARKACKATDDVWKSVPRDLDFLSHVPNVVPAARELNKLYKSMRKIKEAMTPSRSKRSKEQGSNSPARKTSGKSKAASVSAGGAGGGTLMGALHKCVSATLPSSGGKDGSKKASYHRQGLGLTRIREGGNDLPVSHQGFQGVMDSFVGRKSKSKSKSAAPSPSSSSSSSSSSALPPPPPPPSRAPPPPPSSPAPSSSPFSRRSSTSTVTAARPKIDRRDSFEKLYDLLDDEPDGAAVDGADGEETEPEIPERADEDSDSDGTIVPERVRAERAERAGLRALREALDAGPPEDNERQLPGPVRPRRVVSGFRQPPLVVDEDSEEDEDDTVRPIFGQRVDSLPRGHRQSSSSS